jgi:predicted nucleic acid-binding Zn finger protein
MCNGVLVSQSMSGKVLIQMENPVTQSIDAVKSLLTWRGRAVDPMPSTLEFVNEGEGSRLVLVLSNKKDGYYVVTPAKCSCPSATYHLGQPCKHQRKHFPQMQAAVATAAESGSIKPAGKWPGGMNGPVDEPIKAVV